MTNLTPEQMRQRIAELEEGLRQTERERDLLRQAVVRYGDRIRMSTSAIPALQQVIDDAFSACANGAGSLLDPASPESEPLEWLIRKSGYFYRPNKRGYTSSIHEAGRYTASDAKSEAAVEPNSITAIHISGRDETFNAQSKYDLGRRDNDIGILIAVVEGLMECSGESLDNEDWAVFTQIRLDHEHRTDIGGNW